ncbi:hypothetical protein DFQ26_004534, partial [Actinomortierella ambigua]
EYAITPGKNEPCLFYVDFDDNIFVYYNFHIHLEPSVPFDNIVKTDPRLYQATQAQQKSLRGQQNQTEGKEQEQRQSLANKDEMATTVPKSSDQAPACISRDAEQQPHQSRETAMTDEDLRGFIHDSLYNVNRYEDEYRKLKRLLEVEEAKKRAVLARMKTAEREAEERRYVRQHTKMAKEEQALLLEHQARVLAFAQAQAAKEFPQQQQHQSKPEETSAVEGSYGSGYSNAEKSLTAHATTTATTRTTSGAAERGGEPNKLKLERTSTTSSMSSLAMTSPTEILAATMIPSLKRLSSGASMSTTTSSNSSTTGTTSTTTTTTTTTTMPTTTIIPPEVLGRRRGSLLIRDVLASYEGKKTPPLVLSPTAASPPSSFFAASTTAESRSTPAMALASSPILKRHSSSSSLTASHRGGGGGGGGGDDPALSLLPPLPPTAGPATTAAAVAISGSATSTTSTTTATASGSSASGGGPPTRKSSGDFSRSGSRRASGDSGGGARIHHVLSGSTQQAQGHVLTSLMKRLHITDLGHGGRQVGQSPSVVSASDAAIFGPSGGTGKEVNNNNKDNDNVNDDNEDDHGIMAPEPGSAASSHSSTSSSLSSTSVRSVGSGSIGHSHGRPITKSSKSHFYHHHHHHQHHHGRPLTPGGHRPHGIVVNHRGSIGRRMSARSRLLMAQQHHQLFQRGEGTNPSHKEEDEREPGQGGSHNGSRKQDDGDGASVESSFTRTEDDSSAPKPPTTEPGVGKTTIERARSPSTSHSGSQSNSRRSSHGGVTGGGGGTGAKASVDFGFGDALTRAAVAATSTIMSPLYRQTSETQAGHDIVHSEGGGGGGGVGGGSSSVGGGEDSSDSCSGGMHTPSTISPIPSPGRMDDGADDNTGLCSPEHAGMTTTTTATMMTSAEPSPSVEGAHEFVLAKSLLSPPSRPGSASSGSTTTLLATTATGSVNKAPASTSTSINTVSTMSAGGSLETGGGASTSANTTMTGEPLTGRRSRAESLLSIGSDVDGGGGSGVTVPDIMLLSSSYSSEMTHSLSAVERLRQEQERRGSSSSAAAATSAATGSLENSPRHGIMLSPTLGSRRASHDHTNSGSMGGSSSTDALKAVLRRPSTRRSVTSGSTEDA